MPKNVSTEPPNKKRKKDENGANAGTFVEKLGKQSGTSSNKSGRKRRRQPENWKRNVSKTKRNVGKKYADSRGLGDATLPNFIPETVKEEEFHLSLALELSKAEARRTEQLQHDDDLKLQVALDESKKVYQNRNLKRSFRQTLTLDEAKHFNVDSTLAFQMTHSWNVSITAENITSFFANIGEESTEAKISTHDHVVKDKKSKSEENVVSCPICLDDITTILSEDRKLMVTVCGHFHCDTCLNEIMDTSRECSKCRKKLTKKNYHPVYF